MTRSLAALSILIVLALPGCDGSPTEIVGGPLVFEGTVIDNGSVTHIFDIRRRGGVRIEVTSLVADPPLDEGSTPSLGLAVGEIDADSGICLASYSISVSQGRRLAFGLEEREYCLRMFDNGTLAADGSRIYSVRIARSE